MNLTTFAFKCTNIKFNIKTLCQVCAHEVQDLNRNKLQSSFVGGDLMKVAQQVLHSFISHLKIPPVMPSRVQSSNKFVVIAWFNLKCHAHQYYSYAEFCVTYCHERSVEMYSRSEYIHQLSILLVS